MIINISDELRIASDELCWKLQRRRKRKDHCEWESFKYFTTCRIALAEAGKREIRLSRACTLTDAVADATRVHARYSRLIDLADELDEKQTRNLRSVPVGKRHRLSNSPTTRPAAKPKNWQVAETDRAEGGS